MTTNPVTTELQTLSILSLTHFDLNESALYKHLSGTKATPGLVTAELLLLPPLRYLLRVPSSFNHIQYTNATAVIYEDHAGCRTENSHAPASSDSVMLLKTIST